MKFLLPILIACCSACDLLCMWLRKFDKDFEEGCYAPEGIVRWGTHRSWRRGEDYRYILIRIPFVSQWRADIYRDVLCWHTPVIYRARDRWHVYWEPVA